MREWELVYGDTLSPPGSHPILPPPEAVLPRYEGDPSSLVSGVETLRISTNRPLYTRTMVDPALPYVPDTHATARAHTTVLPSSSATPAPAPCQAGGAKDPPHSAPPGCEGGGPVVGEGVGGCGGGGGRCCSSGSGTNTTSVITHTRAHHPHTTGPGHKGKCLNGLGERGERAVSRESGCESDSSGGEEWSSGDESDSSTTVSSTHQDPHCDCCYCHMLHHKQGGGRQKYSDRRDRLLQILSRKKKARSCSAISSSGSSINTNASAPQGPASNPPCSGRGREPPLGGQNIDKIMDFIEGNQLDEAKHAKKAAKKARQKQKKMAIRREEEEEEEEVESYG